MRILLACLLLTCYAYAQQPTKPVAKPANKPATKPAAKPAALPDQILYRVYGTDPKQPKQAIYLRGPQLTADIRSLASKIQEDPSRFGNPVAKGEAHEEIWIRLKGRLTKVMCADCSSGIGIEMSTLRRYLRDAVARRAAQDLPEVELPEDEPEEE